MKFLFKPIDPSSLVLFRVVFGLLGFGDVLGIWIYYHLMVDAFHPDRFQFRYIGFEWLPTFYDPWMSILILSIALAGLLVALGWWYKWASWYFAFGFTYLFLLEKSAYLNHAYLFAWIAFLMPFFPLDRTFSLRVRRYPELRVDQVPYWPLFLLRFLMGLVYFYGGIAKVNPDWLRAVPLNLWMSARGDMAVIGPILAQDWVPWLMAYGGLFLDLMAPFLLLSRYTRPWIFLFILGFHFSNSLIFNIGIFPTLSITLSALFFRPDFPKQIIQWFNKRWSWFNRQLVSRGDELDRETLSKPLWHWQPQWKSVITMGILVLMLIHLVLPLRHLLFPGQVTWTEEGHRYAWRMMLRTKWGVGTFVLKEPNTDWKERVELEEHLWDRQLRKLHTHPDMVWQFAQYLRRLHQDEHPGVQVFAEIRVKLNDYPLQWYIDHEVDLGQVSWSFWKPSPWIKPAEFDRSWSRLLPDKD